MSLATATLANCMVVGCPRYHPPYIKKNGATEQSRLTLSVASLAQKNPSYFNGIILWGKFADLYSHLLYRGKYVTLVCELLAERVQARYKSGDLVYEHDGSMMMTDRYTYKVKYLDLGQDSDKAIQYLNKKSDKEVRAGIRLPAWNVKSITRTSGVSDWDLHKEWFYEYIRAPWAGQGTWFGHAKVTIWRTQENTVPTGKILNPPSPEDTRRFGDYVVDGRIIPFDDFVKERLESGLINPITGQRANSPEAELLEENQDRTGDGKKPLVIPSGMLF